MKTPAILNVSAKLQGKVMIHNKLAIHLEMIVKKSHDCTLTQLAAVQLRTSLLSVNSIITMHQWLFSLS